MFLRIPSDMQEELEISAAPSITFRKGNKLDSNSVRDKGKRIDVSHYFSLKACVGTKMFHDYHSNLLVVESWVYTWFAKGMSQFAEPFCASSAHALFFVPQPNLDNMSHNI